MADPNEELDRMEEQLRKTREKKDDLGRAIETEQSKTERPKWRPDHANDGGVI